MSDLIPNIDAWIIQVPKPTDGDIRDAASVNIGLEALAHRTFYLYTHGFRDSSASLTPPYLNFGAYYISGSIVLVGASTISFASPTARPYQAGPSGIYMVDVSATQWIIPTGSSAPLGGAYEQGSDVTTGSAIWWRMDVPSESTVTGVSVWVDPPAGHGGVLPTTRPTIRAYVVNPMLGTFGLIAGSTTSDPTAIGSYEAAHQFATGVLAGAVGPGEFVVVAITGEFGGSAQPGLLAYPPVADYTRTKLG